MPEKGDISKASSLPEKGTPNSKASSLPEKGTPNSKASSLPEKGTPNSKASSLPEKGTPNSKAHSLPEKGKIDSKAISPPKMGNLDTKATTLPENKKPNVMASSLPEKGRPAPNVSPLLKREKPDHTTCATLEKGQIPWPSKSTSNRTANHHVQHTKKTKIPIKIKDIPGKTLRYSRKPTKIPIRLESLNSNVKNDQTSLKGDKETTKLNTANINNTQKNLFNFFKDYYNSRTKERVKLRAHKTVKVQSTKNKIGPTKRVKPASKTLTSVKTSTQTTLHQKEANKKTLSKTRPKTLTKNCSQSSQASTPASLTTRNPSTNKTVNIQPTKNKSEPMEKIKPNSKSLTPIKTSSQTNPYQKKLEKTTMNKTLPKTLTKILNAPFQAKTPTRKTSRNLSIRTQDKINQTPTKTKLNIRKFQITLNENKQTYNHSILTKEQNNNPQSKANNKTSKPEQSINKNKHDTTLNKRVLECQEKKPAVNRAEPIHINPDSKTPHTHQQTESLVTPKEKNCSINAQTPTIKICNALSKRTLDRSMQKITIGKSPNKPPEEANNQSPCSITIIRDKIFKEEETGKMENKTEEKIVAFKNHNIAPDKGNNSECPRYKEKHQNRIIQAALREVIKNQRKSEQTSNHNKQKEEERKRKISTQSLITQHLNIESKSSNTPQHHTVNHPTHSKSYEKTYQKHDRNSHSAKNASQTTNNTNCAPKPTNNHAAKETPSPQLKISKSKNISNISKRRPNKKRIRNKTKKDIKKNKKEITTIPSILKSEDKQKNSEGNNKHANRNINKTNSIPTPPNPKYKGLTKNQKKKLKRKNSKPINNNIRVTHINTQHSHTASLTLAANLEKFYDPKIPHIVKIMEPLCNKKGTLIDIPKNYRCYIKTNSKNTPRAAILVSENIEQKIMFHDSLTDRDNCTISIKDSKVPDKRHYINANYLPYEEKVGDNLLLKIIKHANSTKSGLITGSDTNCQSTLWGNSNTNNRGRELEDLLNDENINIENTTHEHTWSARGHTSTIDLTLTNGLAPNVANWQILQNVSESDHSYINYEIELQAKPTNRPTVNKTDWNKFDEVLKKKGQTENNPKQTSTEKLQKTPMT